MSIKNLMHSLIGASSQGSALQNAAMGTTATQIIQNSIISQMGTTQRKYNTKKIFDGRIEVQQVANGFVVHIGVREGYEYETHIASSITEVNEIIAAQIVAFKLEDKA